MPNWVILTIIIAGLIAMLWSWLSFPPRREERTQQGLDRDLDNRLDVTASLSLHDIDLRLVGQFDAEQCRHLRNYFYHYDSHFRAKSKGNAELVKLVQEDIMLRKFVEMLHRVALTQESVRHKPIGATASMFWDLLGLLFSRKMRKQIYDPVIGELKEDLLLARACRRSPAARRWIQICFFVRTSLVFLDCVRIALSRPLGKLVPLALRALWGSLR
jgi:hypothetical protein